MVRRIERMALLVMVGLLVVFTIFVVVSCGEENLAVAPKPAEANPQFVLERRMRDPNGNTPSVYVIRDKVNNKLIYAVPGCGIAVESE